jgi:ABC-type multidrug transport system ATPase subunit
MLTGLIEATAGNAIAFKEDMFKNAEEVRKIMGICP